MDRSALEAAQPVVYASDASRIAALRGVSLSTSAQSAGTSAEEPYYWAEDGDPSPDVGKIIRHNIHWMAFGTVYVMEYIGDFFSTNLGLTNSRYEWAFELARRQEDEAEEREMAEEQQRRWEEIRRLRELEESGNEDGAAAPVMSPGDGPGRVEGAEEREGEGDAQP